MTTMANGRWILSQAGGKQQRYQPESGDRRGHQHRPQRRLAPRVTHSTSEQAFGVQLVEVAHQHHAVEHGDAQQGNEADRGRHGQVLARQPQPTMPPTSANGMLLSTSSAWRTEPKVVENRITKITQRQRHHQRQPRRALLVLELPPQAMR